MSKSSILTINRSLLGATTPGQRGIRSGGNKGVLRITHSSSITGISPDYFKSSLFGGDLLLCIGAVGVFNIPNRLGCIFLEQKKKKKTVII